MIHCPPQPSAKWMASLNLMTPRAFMTSCLFNPYRARFKFPNLLVFALHIRKKRSWDKKSSIIQIFLIENFWPFKTNENNIIGRVYAQKVELLVRLKPIMLEEGLFAVHSDTTINIFLKDLPAMAQFKVPVGFSQHLGLRGQRLEMLGQRDLPTVLTSS